MRVSRVRARCWSATADRTRPSSAGLELLFSGEESLGRYIDLHAQHDLFLNLPFVKRSEDRPSYMRFLSEFDRFPDIAREDKGGDYRAYVASLHDYLLGFMRRARPLFETDAAMTKADADFAERWERGEVPGWPRASADEGLYCVACARRAPFADFFSLRFADTCAAGDRLFNKQTVFDSHLPGKKHQKALARLLEATQGKQPDDATVTAKRLAAIKLGQEGERETARLEFRISLLAELLGSVREDTKGNVERRQLRTAEERAEDAELEVEAPIQAEHDDSDEEEKPIYNPLNLPLGWDGKPIPYWLYRLHGLGVAYTCQICGDYTFMGRKAFERHFGVRHAHTIRRPPPLLTPNGLLWPVARAGMAAHAGAQALWHPKQQALSRGHADSGRPRSYACRPPHCIAIHSRSIYL